jgi:hypothetical protein
MRARYLAPSRVSSSCAGRIVVCIHTLYTWSRATTYGRDVIVRGRGIIVRNKHLEQLESSMRCKAARKGQPAYIMKVAGPLRGASLRSGLLLLARSGFGVYGFPFSTLA